MEQGYAASVGGQNGASDLCWTLLQQAQSPSPTSRAKSETGEAGPNKSLRRNAILRKIYEQKDREEETTKRYEEAMNEAKSVQSLAPPALSRKKSNSLPDLARLHEQGLIHQLWPHGPTQEGSSETLGSRAASPMRRSPCHVSPRMSPYPSVWPHSNDAHEHSASSLPKTSFVHGQNMPHFSTATAMSNGQASRYRQAVDDSPPIPSLMLTSPEEESASLLWNDMDLQEGDCTSVEELTDILASLIDTQGTSATSSSPQVFSAFSQPVQATFKTSSSSNTNINPFAFQSSPLPPYHQQEQQLQQQPQQSVTFTSSPSFSTVPAGSQRTSQQTPLRQVQPNNYALINNAANTYGNTYNHQIFSPDQYVYVTSTSTTLTAPTTSTNNTSPYLWIPPTRTRVSSMPSLRHFSTSQTDTTAFCGGIVEDLSKAADSTTSSVPSFPPPITTQPSPYGQATSSYHNYEFYNQVPVPSNNTTESETFMLPTPIQAWNATFDSDATLDLLNSLSECKFSQSQDVNAKAQEASDYMERLRLADNYVRKELGIAVSDPDFL